MEGIFEGLTVLDFSQVLAGPTATRLMVELGADVIKVEFAPDGDIGRVLPEIRDGRSGYFVQQNRGKRSLCVDLKDPRGRDLVLDLVPHADVMVQNFAFGVIDRLGFGYGVVSEINPSLVVCNMSAFGTRGPLRDQPGYDPIAQAWGGVLHMLGYADRAPILAGISPGDVLTGVHAFGGIAAALYHRERTGRGQLIDVSLLGSYVTTHEVNWQAWSVSDGERQPIRNGNAHPVVGGVGVFELADGDHVAITVLNDNQWRGACEVMGRPELAADPRFVDSAQRVANNHALNEVISDWVRTESDREALVARLESQRVPAAPVLSLAEAAVHPNLHESGALRWVDDDVLGRVLVPGMPLSFSDSVNEPPLDTRYLGQDNEYLVCEVAGRSPADYEALTTAGVLHHDPTT